jgi:hypothetical protein
MANNKKKSIEFKNEMVEEEKVPLEAVAEKPIGGITLEQLKKELSLGLNHVIYKIYNGLDEVMVEDNKAIAERFDTIEAKLNMMIKRLNEIEK